MSSSKSRPEITVVIPTLGKSPHLRGLLERLQRQTVSVPVEVLVVANIPSQSLRETVMSFRTASQVDFEYLETGRIGVNLARNKGLDRSRGSIVLFLDDDAILDNDRFLETHFELHRQHGQATALGGPYRLSPQAGAWDLAYHDVAHEWLKKQTKNSPANETHHLLGGNVSFKHSHLSQNNWRFDEEITFGGAESGLCQRISVSKGTLLFFEELELGHAPQLGAHAFCRKAFLQGAGAEWRQRNIPAPASTFINEYLPSGMFQNDFRHRLYRLCFDFGFSSAPFSRAKPRSLKSVGTPKLNYLRLILFRIRQIALGRELKTLLRNSYASLRCAWINVQVELKKHDLEQRPSKMELRK